MADRATKLFYEIASDDEVYSVRKINEALAAARVDGQTLALTTAVEQLLLPIPRRVVIDRLRAEIAALERGKGK